MDIPIHPGDIINDAYKVERVIGAGGMAVVVSALDLNSPRRVAIKVLFRKAALHPEVLKRFEREQRVIQQLRGEHVARCLDGGIYKNAPYMVMEYLQGSDLAHLLKVQGPLPIEQAVEYLLQTCLAVAEAHAYEIVHRDLKPGNLFLTRRSDGSPRIKVLDFGIAKVTEPPSAGGSGENTQLTKTTTIMGSPYYMSPEQVISPRSVAAPSDIWSLGVILYELIAGKIPFAAKTPERVCARVLNDPPDPLTQHRPECPPELEAAIVKCLQRKPSNRHADVAELARSIAPFAPKHARDGADFVARILAKPSLAAPVNESMHEIVISRDPGTETVDVPTVYIPAKKGVDMRNVAMVAFGVVMLGVGFAGGFLMKTRHAPLPAPAASSALPTAAPPIPPSSSEESPDPAALAADIPIEMDLDDEAARLAAQKRMEMRRRRDAEAETPAPDSNDSTADASAPPAASTPTAPPPSTTKSSSPPGDRTGPASTSTSSARPASTAPRASSAATSPATPAAPPPTTERENSPAPAPSGLQ